MPLSQDTLSRLEKFKASDKYINLSPDTKTRLDNFLMKSQGGETSGYSPMAKEYFDNLEKPKSEIAPQRKGVLGKIKEVAGTYLKEAQPAFKLAITHPETLIGKPAMGPMGKPLTPEELGIQSNQDWSDIYRGAGQKDYLPTEGVLPFARSTSTAGQLIPQIAGSGLDVGTRPSSYVIPRVATGTAAFAAKTPITRAILALQTPTLAKGLLAGTRPEVLTGIQGLAQKGITKAVKPFIPSPEKMLTKAEKLTTEILNPPKGELASYIARNKKMPAIEETMKVINKSKNYGEIGKNIDNVIKDTMSLRNGLLEQYDIVEGNKSLGDYTKGLKDYIKTEIAKGQSTSSEIRQMQDVLNRELEFLKTNPLNRVKGQLRKEYLQDKTESLLQKTEKGDIIDTQPTRNRALDQLRRGLRQEVERGLDGENKSYITELNSRYGGLRRAKELVSGQEALSQKAVPQSLLERVFRLITKPQDIPQEVAREAFKTQQGLSKKTQTVESLIRRAGLIPHLSK
jgi:hypothetical protein